MKTQKIVITGGPGTGKTSLIEALEKQGFMCMPEISRAVTQEAQKLGIDQLFLHDPLLFSKQLFKGRLNQFLHPKDANGYLFYDRGLPDVTAYLRYLNTTYPLDFDEACRSHRYNTIFLLPPWKAIYRQDNERYESFEQALQIFEYLKETYQDYGYPVIEVPTGSLEERIGFIQNTLSPIG